MIVRELFTTTAFERDLRRLKKQGKDIDKLEAIVDLVQAGQPLPPRCREHPLGVSGQVTGIVMSNRIDSCCTSSHPRN